MTFDLTETDRLLTTTRAVRKRLDRSRPVDREVVLECIDLATQAPNGGNGQRWRWLVVEDPPLKQAIGHLYAASYEDYITPKRTLIAPDDHVRLRMTGSSDFLAEHLGEVPFLVIPCVLDVLDRSATREEQAGFWGGILPAVWSFQLALRSRGLGSAWTTLHLTYEREVGALLGIPETVTQVALLPVAYTIGADFQPAPRRPAAEVTYFDTWGKR